MLLFSPFLAVLLARRLAAGKSRDGWEQRWGHLPPEAQKGSASRIWLHAASVGEVMAAVPVLKRLRERLPSYDIVISTITPGGQEAARQQAGSLASAIFYLPFDTPWAVRRALRTLRPNLLVVMETEIWPNLLHHLRESGVCAILINGRISDRSLPRYRRARWLIRWALSRFDRILAQTEQDAARFRQIGAEAARVEVAGNSKFDESPGCLTVAEAEALRADLNLPPGARVLAAGSTRSEEEEAILIDAYKLARQRIPDLALIVAPRHIERAPALAARMREAGLAPVRRSEMAPGGEPARHLILDTFGELARVYALAGVAFVGNSLTSPGGGQNLLQPLAQGKPVLHGPYMANFRDIAALAGSEGVAFTVRNAEELAAETVRLLEDESARGAIAEKSLALLESSRGAADRYADAIVDLAGRNSSIHGSVPRDSSTRAAATRTRAQ